jgi:hypothetical protein
MNSPGERSGELGEKDVCGGVSLERKGVTFLERKSEWEMAGGEPERGSKDQQAWEG